MARAHEVLGGRWTLLIVREILCGSRRFNDIRRGIPRVSRTVLSERLQALVFVGAIARTNGPFTYEVCPMAAVTREPQSET
jgi:DNA-binding HxlR family transcriptional regulator